MRFYSYTLIFLIFSLSCHPLIDVKQINNAIVTDIRYATTNNFTGKKVYQKDLCFVHNDLASKLNAIQQELNKEGLGLKIWDAYRPKEAQETFWNIVPDPRYVSHPETGGRTHLRGIALDVTLVDLKTHKELIMPTEFDDFSSKAHAYATENINHEALANRITLQNIMVKYGFVTVPYEWWHFQIKNWKDYPILTTNFSELSS